MSEKFNGFSQDEIKKYSAQGNQKKTTSLKSSSLAVRGSHGEGIRRMTGKTTLKGTLKKQQTGKVLPEQKNAKKNDAGVILNDGSIEEIDLDQCLSQSIEEALFYQPPKKAKSKESETENENENIFKNLVEETKTFEPAGTNSNEDVNDHDSSIIHLSDKSGVLTSEDSCDSSILSETKNTKTISKDENVLNLDSPFKGISLKDFETHRRMIEEQNKQKKEMLRKAIEQYSKKTAAEARKIEEIKSELSKLDNDLALDVAILRKQIDMACIHFANMEKQYMKIESQFLKAKIDLHNAAEKKELLTEHLCTVIAHNEDRKAQKLSELMQKVGLTTVGELEPNEALIKNSSD